jgi:polyisoprenoid-binding protein YceI
MSTIIREVEQAVPAGTWTLDKVHSQVGFAVEHAGVSLFRGGLDDFEATLEGGALSGKAGVASIKVQDENLSGHLLSPDFFDAARFPEISFVSTALRRDRDELTVEGELEIRGVRRSVRLTGTIAGPVGDRIGITLETTVDRTDFGMNWNMELPSGGIALENEVRLTADLELVKGS